MFDSPVVEVLRYRECLRLLGTARLGRVLYTEEAMPAVRLVDFALNGGEVVVRSHRGSPLVVAIRDAVVAFEVDKMALDLHSGWSVSVIGHAVEVIDQSELDVLAAVAPPLWAPVDSCFKIDVERISGERIRT